jgi:hypothetical protein
LRATVTGEEAAAGGLCVRGADRDPDRGVDGPAVECRAERADPACADPFDADGAESLPLVSACAMPPVSMA